MRFKKIHIRFLVNALKRTIKIYRHIQILNMFLLIVATDAKLTKFRKYFGAFKI